MIKEKLNDIIVVEGVHDVQKIQSIYDVDVLYTNGSAISREFLQKLQFLSQTRSIIVFTDPDFPGKKIRQTIIDEIPTAKHAFIPKERALGKGKVGIEHASVEDIRYALANVVEPRSHGVKQIEWSDLVERDLVIGQGAKQKRTYIANRLHLGHVNTKQFCKQLQMFGIEKERLDIIIEEFDYEKSRNME